MTAPSPDDLPGLVEAVARKMFDADCEADGVSPEDRDWLWSDDTSGSPLASEIYDCKARAAVAAALKVLRATECWEYGVERGPFGDKFPAHIEWGRSVGMSHYYEYTAESVHALASGRPVFRRRRIWFPDVVGEPEPYERET